MTLTVVNCNNTLPGESQDDGIRYGSAASELQTSFSSSAYCSTVKMDRRSASLKSLIYDEFKQLEDSVLMKLSQAEAKRENLTKLKKHFEEKISSKRAFDRIHDFTDLFRVLKKRDQLSYNKLEPFKYASIIIGDKNLSEKISELEEQIENFDLTRAADDDLLYENAKSADAEYQNISHSQQVESSSKIRDKSHLPNLATMGFSYSQGNNGNSSRSTTRAAEIQRLVLNRISDRIGNRWRDLARYLDVREVDIDAIEVKYHTDLKEKAYQALMIFQSQHNSEKWKMQLMRALEKARRKDLRDWVEDNY